MTALIISSGLLGYIVIVTWMFGYLNQKLANDYNLEVGHEVRTASYYRDKSPKTLLCAMFWPLYIVFAVVLARITMAIHNNGERVANRSYQKVKLRIELEKKVRIEHEEAIEEVEAAMLNYEVK